MGWIGNAPSQGLVTGGGVVDGSIETVDIKDKAITAAKLGDTAIADKLGYTPQSAAQVAAAIAALVNSAPSALDTLKELSDALGADANFATTVTNALAGKQASLGYTPVNKAGDTITGRTVVSVPSGKQFTLAQWGDASSSDGGQTMIAGNAYFDKTSGQAKYSNSHGTIGAVGIRFNSPSWNEGSLFTAGGNGSTADANFTPLDALRWDSSGRVLMPYQPAFALGLNVNWTIPGGGNQQAQVISTNNGASLGFSLNRGSHFNGSTGRFTAPIAGVYLFAMSDLYYINGAGYVQSGFRTNAGSAFYKYAPYAGSNPYGAATSVYMQYLNAGDWVEFYALTNQNGSYLHGGGYNLMTGYLVG